MMLRHVDASDEQKDRATEIAESAFDALAPMLSTHREGREQMVALLSEETIDREALEALRAELVARFDTASRTLAGSLADLAETLTPEQRAELLEHGRGHRGWHRRW
jgi:Spy/CpxP family protein refolding chaperone